MAKKIRSNYKIYVKTFTGATVSCMEDYMESKWNPLFERNSPDHFACWDERSILCKVLFRNHRINNKSGMST